ncbi:MAG TPA: hypothetical protein VKB02_13380 [Pyrinomonadaceae bacterium]|nr:hypothetical protein [Pyrinomonadaceae bacterium]
MRRVLFTAFVLALCAISAFAQKSKPWTELTEKEAAKILNDSPWGQTQTEGEDSRPEQTSAVTQVAAPRAANNQMSREGEAPDTRPSKVIKYRMRFLSAKPVRAAFARYVMLKKPDADEILSTQLQDFVDRDFADYVVVAVTAEAADPRLVGPTMQFLSTATAEVWKDKVYLERKDGKRAVLADYRPPGPDGMGAKFVFMRSLEGQPFLTVESDNVRFFAQLSEKMKLNVKYKVSDMMYDGKLEY